MKRSSIVIAASVAMLFLSGCGTTDGPSTSSSNVSSAVPEAVQELAAEAAAEKPWMGPETSPAIAEGAFVVSIPCSLAAAGCARWDEGVHAAGDELGWTVQTIDPAFDPAKANQAVRQAIDLGADAIVMWVLDPVLVASSVAEARAAGIVVVGGANAKEDEPVTPEGFQHGVTLSGQSQGEWLAARACIDLDGQGQVLVITDPSYDILTQRVDAMKAYVSANCPDIELIVEQVSSNDAGTVLQSKVAALLQRNPDVKGFITPVDIFTTDVIVALNQLGKSDVKVYSIDGDPSSVGNIAEGGPVVATVGSALELSGWATLDNVNRLLQGEPANENDGVPNRMVTKDFIPQDLIYRGDVDYREIYTKLWKTGSL